MEYQITNPRRVSADMIDVTWNHPRLGVIDYTCQNGSGEEQMQEIWDLIMAGEFGPVAE